MVQPSQNQESPPERAHINFLPARQELELIYDARGKCTCTKTLFRTTSLRARGGNKKKRKCGKLTAWYGTTSLFKSLQELRIARELLFSLFAFSTPRCVANYRSCLMTIGACGMGCHCKKQARRHFSFLFFCCTIRRLGTWNMTCMYSS